MRPQDNKTVNPMRQNAERALDLLSTPHPVPNDLPPSNDQIAQDFNAKHNEEALRRYSALLGAVVTSALKGEFNPADLVDEKNSNYTDDVKRRIMAMIAIGWYIAARDQNTSSSINPVVLRGTEGLLRLGHLRAYATERKYPNLLPEIVKIEANGLRLDDSPETEDQRWFTDFLDNHPELEEQSPWNYVLALLGAGRLDEAFAKIDTFHLPDYDIARLKKEAILNSQLDRDAKFEKLKAVGMSEEEEAIAPALIIARDPSLNLDTKIEMINELGLNPIARNRIISLAIADDPSPLDSKLKRIKDEKLYEDDQTKTNISLAMARVIAKDKSLKLPIKQGLIHKLAIPNIKNMASAQCDAITRDEPSSLESKYNELRLFKSVLSSRDYTRAVREAVIFQSDMGIQAKIKELNSLMRADLYMDRIDEVSAVIEGTQDPKAQLELWLASRENSADNTAK